VRFEWDEEKNEINKRKHGISFETGSRVFFDRKRLEYIERMVEGEERWHAIGIVREARVLLVLTVVHAYREEGVEPVIRIISARRATPQERRAYAETIL
jgi:uncharacterized DUF497 family protein